MRPATLRWCWNPSPTASTTWYSLTRQPVRRVRNVKSASWYPLLARRSSRLRDGHTAAEPLGAGPQLSVASGLPSPGPTGRHDDPRGVFDHCPCGQFRVARPPAGDSFTGCHSVGGRYPRFYKRTVRTAGSRRVATGCRPHYLTQPTGNIGANLCCRCVPAASDIDS